MCIVGTVVAYLWGWVVVVGELWGLGDHLMDLLGLPLGLFKIAPLDPTSRTGRVRHRHMLQAQPTRFDRGSK